MSEEIKEIEAAFFGAMQANDPDTMETLMAEDCIYIHSFGSKDTKQSYLRAVRDRKFDYRTVNAEQETIVMRGDVAVVTGTMIGEVIAGGEKRRLNNVRSSVWAKQGGDWKLVLFQPTPRLDQ
jgi:uncharacterized protein (TIGR02246 family)